MIGGGGQHVDGGSAGSQSGSDDNPMDSLAAMMTKLKVCSSIFSVDATGVIRGMGVIHIHLLHSDGCQVG